MQCLYFAEFDLAFFKTRSEMIRHLRKCKLQHPPGDEIYRNITKGINVSMFEACFLCEAFMECNQNGFKLAARSAVFPSVSSKYGCAFLRGVVEIAAGGWKEGEAVLPESVLSGQALPGPQDVVL